MVGLAGLGVALLWFEVEVRRQPGSLPDWRWSAASPVYARPALLREGSRLDARRLRAELTAVGYRPTEAARPAPGRFRTRDRLWFIGLRPLPGASGDTTHEVSFRLDASGRLRDLKQDGAPTTGVLLEPQRLAGLLDSRAREQIPHSLHELPEVLVDAVLAIEDRRFFDHRGLDPWRIAGAFSANLRAGRAAQGASTITQQLARSLHLNRERSLTRKLREATLAVKLERSHGKAGLLEAYLNEVYLGQMGSAALHGVGAAARHYFGRDAREVDLAESALLAALIRGPSYYAPHRYPERALARRNLVLRQMAEVGWISGEEAQQAAESPIDLVPRRPRRARHFVARVERELRRAGVPRTASVVTSLDPILQAAAERAVVGELRALESALPQLQRPGDPLEAALVALVPQSGDVLAWVGGRSFGRSQLDRVTTRRQPGSVFKPIVLAAALGSGHITLSTRLRDRPLSVPVPEGRWRPQNYDRRYRGSVTLRNAIERSLNVPMARLGLKVGLPAVADTAQGLGVESPLARVPSLALGSSEVTLLEMATAYASFASGGLTAAPRSRLLVSDAEGRTLERPPTRATRTLERGTADLVSEALRGVVARGTARSLTRRLGAMPRLAAKTGTTNDFRDAWFLAYTSDLVVGVWVGFDDGRSTNLSGARAALPVFARLVEELGPLDRWLR